MAKIIKQGGGLYTASESTAGAVTAITIPAPPVGFAVSILKVLGFQSGGTSTEIRCNYQSTQVAGSPDAEGVNRDLDRHNRTAAGIAGLVDLTFPDRGLMGGNGHQIDIALAGNVADSTLSNLWVLYKFVAIR